jgi:hypothetical protein
MKINEEFESYLIPTTCDKLGSKEEYSTGKDDDRGFYLINFHPSGESEASICCVAKDLK